MNVGILSINLHTRKLNYGAVLHSWASQQLMLRRPDVDSCEIIDYVTPSVENAHLKYIFLDELRPRLLLRPKALVKLAFQSYAQARRYNRFQDFFRKRLNITSEKYTQRTLAGATLPYDTLLIESDVIWSPGYLRGELDPAFFGALDSMRNMRRVVYAASMGGSRFNDAQTAAFERLLKYPHAISVRETYNAAFTRLHTDKPVCDVIDPALLLESEDYDGIAEPPRRPVKEPYVLVYFPLEASSRIAGYAAAYARRRGWQVIEISERAWHAPWGKTFSHAGIGQFVWLVRHAQAVFCNSVHGVCLSLLFHREFFAFERSNGKKYQDLCRKFGLEDRYIPKGGFDEPAEPIQWDQVEARLKQLREESRAWLDAALCGTLPG